LEEHHEFGDYAFNAVGDEDLVAVELNAVFGDFEVVVDFGEEEYSGEGEGVVDVEVDPE
jgi:hypothetical protein